MGEKPVSVEFVDNSDAVLDKLQAAKIRALTRCGQEAEGYAKDLSAVITGLQQNSITYALSGKAPAITTYKANTGDGSGSYSGVAPDDDELSVYIGTNVEYAPANELGTATRTAKPFLKPAVANHAQTYKNIMEDELKNA